MKKVSPSLALRLGLAATFIYAGTNILLNPSAWIGFVPQWIESIPLLSRTLMLQAHAILELLLATALITGTRKKEAALLTFLDLAFILIFYGIDDATFRDIGLLAAAYALFLTEQKAGTKSEN